MRSPCVNYYDSNRACRCNRILNLTLSMSRIKGTLVVGLDTFAPMGFRDKDDKLVGFDIDLARAVTKKMGVKELSSSLSDLVC